MSHNQVIQDAEQRKQALNPRQSFIVQAPAGSGKTELLTQRFLTLLLNVEKKPEEILAITFTNKAASEMRARIITKLQMAQLKEPSQDSYEWQTWRLANQVLQRSKQLQWDLLDNPNRLKIMTIDAFCAQLTQQLPLLAQFGVQPAINSEPQILYESAIDSVLQDLEGDFPWTDPIAILLTHLDNDYLRLKRLLLKLLESREQWLPHITSDISMTKEHLNRALLHIVEAQLMQLEDALSEIDDYVLLQIILFVASNIDEHHTLSIFIKYQIIEFLPNFEPEHLAFWQAVGRLFLTTSLQWRKQIDKRLGFPAASSATSEGEKELFSQLKKHMQHMILEQQDNEKLLEALGDTIQCPASQYDPKQWIVIQALVDILPVLVAQLTVEFRDKGQVDFSQMATQALVSLGCEENPTDLSLALDYTIQHILIDEFQDTSQTQFRLLELLTCGWEPQDGRTLFLVGDPMQSIYRFRQAEVGLFLKALAKGVGHISLTPIILSTNFRSTSTLVNWINETFHQVFPPANDLIKGAIQYSASQAFNSSSMDSHVKLCAFDSENEASSTDYIVDTISKIQAEDPQASIAILVKSRSHLAGILPTLQLHKIPYQAVEIEPLCDRPVIQDLWHLTRALLYLADRTAWLALLRAPWCGLVLSDLLTLSQDSGKTLWQQLSNPSIIEQLSLDGQTRVYAILPALQKAMNHQGRLMLRDWVETLWKDLCGPGYLSVHGDFDDAKQYLTLLEQHQQGQDLPELTRFEKKLQTLYASAASVENAVQVMTIHKSKGLEFDTVILPGLERQPPMDQAPLLAWIEQPQEAGGADLLLAPIPESTLHPDPIYQYVRKQQSIKSFYEIKRLLYVACTRAKNKLYLLAQLATKEDEILPPRQNSLLGHLWPCQKNQFAEAFIQESVPPLPAKDINTLLPGLKRMKSPLSKQQSSWDLNIVDNSQYSELVDTRSNITGTVTHHLIHQLTLKGIAHWKQQSLDQWQIYIGNQLRLEGLGASNFQEAIHAIISHIENMLADPRGQWLLAPHRDSQAEIPMTYKDNKAIKHVVIDRSFLCQDHIRWIIDYKTSEPKEDSIENFVKNQRDRNHNQLEQYAQCFPLDKNIMLALYFPACQGWTQWKFNK